jgi:hypothetical protein
MKRNFAPMRRDHLAGVEGLIAIAAQDQGSIVAEHFELNLAHGRVDASPISPAIVPGFHRLPTSQQYKSRIRATLSMLIGSRAVL